MTDYITVARPYAKAVFLIAKEENTISGWSNLLAVLDEISADVEASDFISRPDFSLQEKTQFLQTAVTTLLKRKLTNQEANFLSVILEAKRYEVFSSIRQAYDEMVLSDESIVEVDLVSAFEVKEAENEMFVKALEKHFQKSIKLNVSVDPNLIGGAVIKAGDWVMDGSVKGRLEQMTSFLVQSA
ncbi:F0F1 ATP synthase subunit delta [Acinetobacter sp.]|jgi:F-type H+-transporting ATPase subunit delta|uniref:F0F1 ATP synthase subunit delta n=1 Tax=Acinetobacter sp. TaxID=472 RepID=UPI00282B2E1D|nr:F0F1 ATP synthase subunit delta [Acinetobacter sp.]MDR0234916.1 F0F1 ATP synthase subunit delta [Acinetobacter sp.]